MTIPTLLRSFVVITVVAACGGPAGPSAAPTATGGLVSPAEPSAAPADTGAVSPPAATAEPSISEPTQSAIETEPARVPDPGLWAQEPPTPLLMNSAVQPYVGTLNVRRRPSTSAAIVGTVKQENILQVRSAPIEADGYIWYMGTVVSDDGTLPVLPKPLVISGDPIQGWFAAGKVADGGFAEYVVPVEARCPDATNLANVVAMLGAERRSCFQNRRITLEGTFGCRGCSAEIFGYYEPDWLANPNRTDFLWMKFMDSGALRLRFPPGLEAPGQGVAIRVRGRFMNAAAADCAIATAYPWAADQFTFHDYGPKVAQELCNQEFVVEDFERL